MLKLSNIHVAIDGHNIIDNISLELQQGQIGCLLGPSGCGKTTLLRTIAGFEQPLSGQIQLHSKTVTDIAVEQRKVGMVFQDFALFPHLTVFDNIAFGLQHLSKPQRHARVEELMTLTELSHRQAHYPHQLSGGQQQRVALARALAPKPDILLLDEPFSSIDTELRESLAHRVRHIIKAEHVTAILVTHDQLEAFAMADHVGVISQGQLLQWDSAYALYHRPANRFIANFIGEGSFIEAKVVSPHSVDTLLGQLSDESIDLSRQHGQSLELLIRPDDIVHDDNAPLHARIEKKYFRGSAFLYHLSVGDKQHVLCHAPSHHNHEIGEAIGIRLEIDHLVTF